MRIVINVLILMLFVPLHSYAVQIGTTAPAFSLIDVNGSMVTLEQFRGKVVFLGFWAPWCIPCKEELPELDKLFSIVSPTLTVKAEKPKK